MSNDRTSPGFDSPIRSRQAARQRTALALIATVALAVSTAIAATVVSIGIARADAPSPRQLAAGETVIYAQHL